MGVERSGDVDGVIGEVVYSRVMVDVVVEVSSLDVLLFPQPASSTAALPIAANAAVGPAFIRTLTFFSAMTVCPPCGPLAIPGKSVPKPVSVRRAGVSVRP